jgi:hypothetical protein
MRQFVRTERLELLHGVRSGQAAARVHHRCRFHPDNHGVAIQLMDDGMKLQSGNGPTTALGDQARPAARHPKPCSRGPGVGTASC